MSERMTNQPMDNITLEEGLKAVLTYRPEPAFVEGLEQRLLERQPAKIHDRPGQHRPSLSEQWRALWKGAVTAPPRLRWAALSLTLLLILIAGLFAIGPQRAWAGLQAWLGYVPGVGFVDLHNTRVLLAPQIETRDGVTVRVTEVIAGSDETTVVLESDGLPAEDELWGGNGAEPDNAFAPLLRLPDGTTLPALTFTLRLGRASLIFPPLPADVYQVALELPLLPLVPRGAAPENWSLPLALQPATGELVAEMYPQPYAPENASDTHHGITLIVTDVAHTAKRTALRIETRWQNEAWEHVAPEWNYGLYDDVGHVYDRYVEPGSGVVSSMVIREPAEPPPPHTSERLYDFEPLSLAASRLTFEVEQTTARVPAEGQFAIDLGANPQIGDRWELDVHLEVAGLPVHITRAWLGTEQLQLRDGVETRTSLNLYVEEVPERNGRSLGHLSLRADHPAFTNGSGGHGAQIVSLHLKDGSVLPSGTIEIGVDSAWLYFHGPWRVQWDIPGAAPGSPPVVLTPDSAQMYDGVSLHLDRVTMTDRLTAVDLTLVGQDEGVMINEILYVNPNKQWDQLTLEDDRLHSYMLGQRDAVWWQPEGWQPPLVGSPSPARTKRLHLPPAQPLVRRLTLTIPAVELARPAAASFTVEVPSNITLTYDEEARGPASEPWPVAINFRLDDYHVHFSEARMYTLPGNGTYLALRGEMSGGGSARPLSGFLIDEISAPDGESVSNHQGHAVSAPTRRSGFSPVNLTLELGGPADGVLRPGPYEVQISALTEIVEGPWEFSWDVRD